MTSVHLGKVLRTARTEQGLSLQALHDRLGGMVSVQALSQFERGTSTPRSAVLIGLARTLGLRLEDLAGGEGLKVTGVELRRVEAIRPEQVRVLGELVENMMERRLELERRFGFTAPRWTAPVGAPFEISGGAEHLELAARAIRNEWGLGTHPLPNMFDLFEKRGIRVLTFYATSTDGFSAQVSGEGGEYFPVVGVHATHWGERQRYTLAHELGHLVLTPPKTDPERLMNQFAGAFLLPAEELRAALGKRRGSLSWAELTWLKRLYGVSMQALTYRCHDLGIIERSQFEVLFGEFEKQGWRQAPYREPEARPPERNCRFLMLCVRAVLEERATIDEICQGLEINPKQLRAALEDPDLTLTEAGL